MYNRRTVAAAKQWRCSSSSCAMIVLWVAPAAKATWQLVGGAWGIVSLVLGAAWVATTHRWVDSWPVSLAWVLQCMWCAVYAWNACTAIGQAARQRLAHSNDVFVPYDMAQKWDAQCFKLAAHAVSAVACYYILVPSRHWFREPLDSDNGLGSAVFLLYSAQVARWFQGLHVHVFEEEEDDTASHRRPRNRDHTVMAGHHVVTLALLLGSWACDFHRVGIAVLLLHDVSDVCVCVMQLLHYAQMQGPNGGYLAEAAFVGNFIVWCWTRLWLFPVYVIGGASSHLLLPTPLISFPQQQQATDSWPSYVLVTCLLALQAMHVYWAWVFVRLAFKIARKGAESAGREEYHHR